MMLSYWPKPRLSISVGIIGLPAGGPDDGAHLQVDGLGLHLQVDRIVFAGFLDRGGVIGADNLRRDDKSGGKGHFKGQIGAFGFAHTEVELIGHFGLAGLGAVAAAGAVFVYIAGVDLEADRRSCRAHRQPFPPPPG